MHDSGESHVYKVTAALGRLKQNIQARRAKGLGGVEHPVCSGVVADSTEALGAIGGRQPPMHCDTKHR